MDKKDTIHFCKNCEWYKNDSPEDVCLNERFDLVDVITGKKFIRQCIVIRNSKTENPTLRQCVGYKDIRKGH